MKNFQMATPLYVEFITSSKANNKAHINGFWIRLMVLVQLVIVTGSESAEFARLESLHPRKAGW